MFNFNFLFVLLALLSLTTRPSTAHSWIEQMQVISENGSYVGDYGYMRGYIERGMGGDLDFLVPAVGTRITTTDLLCPPEQQTPSYKDQYPKLKAQPGDFVAIKYQENGHVTLPQNQPGKPRAAGTVFIFGTTEPANAEKLADVLQWTTDGKGGNGKGYLMTAQNFDDGRCYQVNDGSPISVERQKLFPDPMPNQPGSVSAVGSWCETDLKIPETQGTDKPLTIYWVWSWPTAPGAPGVEGGKDEYYTSCADIDLVAEKPDQAIVHTIAQQDPQTAAPEDFKTRFAYTTSPVITLSGGATVPASEASRLSETPTGSVSLPASAYWSAFSASITPALSQIQRIAAGKEAAPTPAVEATGNNAAPMSSKPASSEPAPSKPASSVVPLPSPTQSGPRTSTKMETVTVTPTIVDSNKVVIVTQMVTVTASEATSSPAPSSTPAQFTTPSPLPSSAVSMPAGEGVGLKFSTITVATRAAAPAASAEAQDEVNVVANAEGVVSEQTQSGDSKAKRHLRQHARAWWARH